MADLTDFQQPSTQVIREHPRFLDVVNIALAVNRFINNSRGNVLKEEKAHASNLKSMPNEAPLPVIRSATIMRKDALDNAAKKVKYFAEITVDQVIRDLNVDPVNGLSSAEAAARLHLHGRNELEKEPPPSFLKLLLQQFSDLLVIMLIVASLVSIGLGEYKAAVVIIIIVIANATLGVIQESRAGAALDALSSLAAPRTDVQRDGQILNIDSAELVPGDVVILDLGRKVPADVRLIESQGMYSNEMALTGESEPVKKNALWVHEEKKEEKKEFHKEEALTEANMVYMGCSVQDGRGKGVVVKTGMKTKMGEIAHLLKTADQGQSPLQTKLHNLGVRLGIASICVSVIVFVIGVATDRKTDPESDSPVWLQMLLVAVSLTVAAVPEGLPACVTITLAVGMNEMVKKNALIRNLHSVETLGSASVICSDKTGTLTKGEMTAVRLWFHGDIFRFTGQGYEPQGELVALASKSNVNVVRNTDPQAEVLRLAVMCSNAELQVNPKTQKWECIGNISERPLVVAGAKVNLDKKQLDGEYKRVKENPFNSARKMMSVLVDVGNGPRNACYGNARYISAVKGAPNFILDKCTHMVDDDQSNIRALEPQDRQNILKAIDDFSGQAFRVLAIAYHRFEENEMPDSSPDNLERDLILCGMIASIDPERSEVTPSIRKAANAGIRTVMITGDYVKTAKAIAENIGLLPRGSPDKKAVDCEIIRQIGGEIEEVKQQLDACDDKDEAKKIEQKLDVLLDRLDSITVYADVYARAKPADKITIVRSLQRQGNICSMTGDGVNDAPALKQANIGVAMGITGTDVAKASADMVLTDDNFCSIVEAIEQGRTIYANISKFVFYLLSTNVSEVFTILIAVIMGLRSPLFPIQILWLNLATDGAPAIALAIEAIEPGVMQEGPRNKNESILEKLMITGIIIQTFTLTSLVLGTYILGLSWHTGSWDGANDNLTTDEISKGVDKARTMTILMITFGELIRAYSCRSMRYSVFQLGLFSNPWMQYAVGTSMAATVLICNIPGVMDIFGTEYLDGRSWAWILCMCWIPFIVDEVTKTVYRYTGYGKRPKIHQQADIVPSPEHHPHSNRHGHIPLNDMDSKEDAV